MEGDESSPVRPGHIGPQQAQLVQQGLGVGFVADPGGVDRRVLTQQQSVSRAGPVPVHVDLLQSQSLLIGDQAQADHLHQRLAAPHLGLTPDQSRLLVAQMFSFVTCNLFKMYPALKAA